MRLGLGEALKPVVGDRLPGRRVGDEGPPARPHPGIAVERAETGRPSASRRRDLRLKRCAPQTRQKHFSKPPDGEAPALDQSPRPAGTRTRARRCAPRRGGGPGPALAAHSVGIPGRLRGLRQLEARAAAEAAAGHGWSAHRAYPTRGKRLDRRSESSRARGGAGAQRRRAPIQLRRATSSTGDSVRSSNCRACSTRCASSQRSGEVRSPPRSAARTSAPSSAVAPPSRAPSLPRRGARAATRGSARASRRDALPRQRRLDVLRLPARCSAGRRRCGGRSRWRGRGAMIAAHDVRQRSMPAATPALVSTSGHLEYRTSGYHGHRGPARRELAVCSQWVVAHLPSSRPAAASTKAPVQIETMRAPRIARSASSTILRRLPLRAGRSPGRSRCRLRASPPARSATTLKPAFVMTCAAVRPHTRTGRDELG